QAGDVGAAAPERRMAEGQETGETHQDVQAERQNAPDDDGGGKFAVAADQRQKPGQAEQDDGRHDDEGKFTSGCICFEPAHYSCTPLTPNSPRGRTDSTSAATR